MTVQSLADERAFKWFHATVSLFGFIDPEARGLAIYLTHTKHGASYNRVAAVTKLDPSTVSYWARRVEDKRDDTVLDLLLNAIELHFEHISKHADRPAMVGVA